MAQQIQLRRDTAANWTTVNPTLAQGEIGLEYDTNKFKIGTGTTAWNALGYTTGGVTSVAGLSPISSTGGTTPSISIADAVADGATKGAAAFNSSDFNSTSGVISIDYANAQSASSTTKGFLTNSDWTKFNNATGGSVGAVDNAVLRADVGTGIVQNSDIVIDDANTLFPITGVASPNSVITCVGNTFATNQQVFFGSLTGGSNLTVNTPYFVRDVGTFGANTFRVSLSVGSGAVIFGSDITAGTIGANQANIAIINNHSTQTNSALVLQPKGNGALIAGPKPDSTAAGGYARGIYAVDLQLSRTSASQVAGGPYSVIVGGFNNNATPTNGNPTATGICIIGGSGNTANNNYNTVISSLNSTASGGQQSLVVGGNGNTASGTSAACIAGGSNTASNTRSIVLSGQFSIASGVFSSVFNGNNCTASADYSYCFGNSASSTRYGMMAYGGGQFSAVGDAQRARFVLRCKTTTNSAVEMALDGATTYLGIPIGKVIACTINISGVKSDGSAVSHFMRQYAVKNVAGTSSQVYAPVTIGTDNAAGTSIALSANDADDTLRIAVTGIAAETWRWVAAVDAVEIGYGT